MDIVDKVGSELIDYDVSGELLEQIEFMVVVDGQEELVDVGEVFIQQIYCVQEIVWVVFVECEGLYLYVSDEGNEQYIGVQVQNVYVFDFGVGVDCQVDGGKDDGVECGYD